MKRTFATLVYLGLIFLSNYITLWIGEFIVVLQGNTFTDFEATTLTFIYLGIGYSLFFMLFVALASIPHPKYLLITLIGAFLIAVFIPIVINMNEDLSMLLYFSPLYYFDIVGLMLSDVLLEKVVPETIVYGAIINVFLLRMLSNSGYQRGIYSEKLHLDLRDLI